MPTFVLNDESVLTSHGFLVNNAGGKFDRFKENPVMLDSHDDRCVIGKWNNLIVSGTQLKADSEFDMEDPDAVKISGKVDRGYIKGASMGIIPLEAENIEIPGLGTQLVLTSWELVEASPVAVPSNKAALRLYAKDGKTVLKLEEIKLSLETIINKRNTNMEKKEIKLSVDAAKVLGLGIEPEPIELNAAIMELSGKLSLATTAKEKAEKTLNDHNEALANELVNLAVKEGRITADRKESFTKLAINDYKQAKDLLESMPAKETLSTKLKKDGDKTPAGREDWNYMKWLKEDAVGLKAMEINDNAKFLELKANYKKQ